MDEGPAIRPQLEFDVKYGVLPGSGDRNTALMQHLQRESPLAQGNLKSVKHGPCCMVLILLIQIL